MALQRIATKVFGTLSRGLERLNARYPWSHNDHFHPWILANLPSDRRNALDVGCGRGELLAELSPAFASVIGSDTDEHMRDQAARRCAGLPNVAVRSEPWNELDGRFDLITMIAVLHHLDVEDALTNVRRMLGPGGRFLVVGLAPPRGVSDHLWEVASVISNPIIGFVKRARAKQEQPEIPPFPTADPRIPFGELRARVLEVMPGAVMKHRLGFRHTIEWTKPV